MTQEEIQERARKIAHICDGNVVLYDDRIEYDIIKLVNEALSACKVTPEQINEHAACFLCNPCLRDGNGKPDSSCMECENRGFYNGVSACAELVNDNINRLIDE